MKALADRISELIDNGAPVAVATILSREGSAPRTAGSKMVIEAGGGFTGTIGGGKFEADVLAAAAGALAEGRPRVLFFDLNHDDADAMDMICGGAMTVLVDVIPPDAREAAVFGAWRQAQETPTRGALVTVMAPDAAPRMETARCMIYDDGRTIGPWPLSTGLLGKLAAGAAKGGAARLLDAENARILLEPTASPKTLFLFGAGHVSVPTARLAAQVGFRVVVADDRAAFASRGRFPEAADVVVLDDFAAALEGLPVDENAFVVIVTRGHRHDKTVLAQALGTRADYVGMIGSRRKRDTIYAALRKEGVADADIARVHCPIGLSIGAETPAEIAVSIVAELIAHRAGAAA